MKLFRYISNGLAPLTLLAAVTAFLRPSLFLGFSDSFLYFFAATMFSLGVVLEPQEFIATLKRPRQIALGLVTQFSVMPLFGFLAAYYGGLSPSTALGFVIVGCAPGAMASNVVVFLAGGAVAYSIALTSFATFLAPVLTPSWVEFLGGVFLPIPFWPMMQTILLTVLLPLLGGMVCRRFLGRGLKYSEEVAPAIAVLAIIIIIGYAVAANHERISTVGARVFLLVVLVNAFGYLAGWTLSRVYRFDFEHRLALTIEIGMQNAGLGVALALEHFSAETALPGAIFATWCILTAAIASLLLRLRRSRTKSADTRLSSLKSEPGR